MTDSESSLCIWAIKSVRLTFAEGETQILSGLWDRKVFGRHRGSDDSSDEGGDCSSRDDDVCSYDGGSAGLTVMGEVMEVMFMAMEEVITNYKC